MRTVTFRRPGRARRSIAAVVIVAAALVLGVFLWSGQNLIDSETFCVSAPGLPSAFDGLRVAVVSDVHGKEFGRDNAGLLDAVRGMEPDIIAITGDLVENAGQLAMVPALARGLAAVAPTYYVTGNHEWAGGLVSRVTTLLRENGVTPLSNEAAVLERDGQKLFLLGIDDPNGPADQKKVGELAQGLREKGAGFILLLAHRNNRAAEYAAAGIDLTLAGHAHGGLIRLPGTDGLIGPSRELLPAYTSGLYKLPYGQIVVSRGLGNVGSTFRLFNNPHLPLAVLRYTE